MTVRDCLADAKRRLKAAGVPDAELDTEYLLSKVLKKTRMELPFVGSQALSQEQERQFAALLLCREKRIPLQYLLHSQNFYGLELSVDSRVLIPRPETETLCERGLQLLHETRRPRVLDLCTGSGAIALAIKQERPDAEVMASDLSEDALTVAKQNAEHLGLQVEFLAGNLFEPFHDQRFDMILSNPPYIPSDDCLSLQEEVRHEPLMALDGGRDGLDFYRRIAHKVKEHLLPGGWLLVECGSTQAEEIARMWELIGLQQIGIINDLFQLPRIVEGRLGGVS